MMNGDDNHLKYESIAWLPNVIAFIAMLAVGYPQLHASQRAVVPTPNTSSILSFASTISAGAIGWCPMTPDYGVYRSPSASSVKIFLCTYFGLVISFIFGNTLGAAFAAAAPNVPAWDTAFQNRSSSVLEPLGPFGKFLTVFVALTAPAMYTFSTSLVCIARIFSLLPRWVYVLVSEVILIPMAILGAQKFYTTFLHIVNITGYWSAAFAGIVLTEHVFFWRALFTETAYPIAAWNTPKLLPRAMPAVLAFLCGIGALMPFMSQALYIGPIAKLGSGDCGIFVALVVAFAVYVALRKFERRWDESLRLRRYPG